MWLAGSPELRRETGLLAAFVGDLQYLLRDYGVHSVWSGEPRRYRLTPRGRALLAEALAEGRVDTLIFSGDGPGKGAVNLVVDLGDRRLAGRALTVHTTVVPAGTTSLGEVATDFAALVLRWFEPLGAAAAFVADRAFPSWPYTAHEVEHGLPSVGSWPGVRRFFRGAFWGTGLGPDLCALLGGQEVVLRAAPVALARPLGDGVWLQLSSLVPAAGEELQRLTEFLAPLLDWSVDDLVQLRTPSPPVATPTVGPTSLAPSRAGPGAPIPLRVLDYDLVLDVDHPGPPTATERAALDEEAVINIHLDAPPDEEQQTTLLGAVHAWLEESVGPAVQTTGPALDRRGAVLRWRVEFFEGNTFDALRDLVRRLRALPGVTVTGIAIGTDELG